MVILKFVLADVGNQLKVRPNTMAADDASLQTTVPQLICKQHYSNGDLRDITINWFGHMDTY